MVVSNLNIEENKLKFQKTMYKLHKKVEWRDFRKQVVHDRKFLECFTDEEFIEYESERLDIAKVFIETALRECGFCVDIEKIVENRSHRGFTSGSRIAFSNQGFRNARDDVN